MPYDHESGLTSKSIFEQFMCTFMGNTYNTCWDHKSGVHMDIWRDAYIWNSMITGNNYEENGSNSEFDWFDPSQYEWDPSHSDHVPYYDKHRYIYLHYDYCDLDIGDYDDTHFAVPSSYLSCEEGYHYSTSNEELFDSGELEYFEERFHYCQDEWYPFVTNNYEE